MWTRAWLGVGELLPGIASTQILLFLDFKEDSGLPGIVNIPLSQHSDSLEASPL